MTSYSALHKVIGPKKEIHDLNGRVALTTGGAMGIDRESLREGRRLRDHGEEAIKKIREKCGQDAKIEWEGCDMGTLSEGKDVFTKIREREDRLDLLILSAGINANQFGKTNDDIDRHFQINWLGQVYVVNLLYPLLRKTSKMPDTPAPRFVFESSEQHRAAPSVVHFGSPDEINNPEIGNPEVYGRTKLAIIVGVKYTLSVHPGAVNTAMQQQWKGAYPRLFGKMLTGIMLAGGRDVEQGSYSALRGLYGGCSTPHFRSIAYIVALYTQQIYTTPNTWATTTTMESSDSVPEASVAASSGASKTVAIIIRNSTESPILHLSGEIRNIIYGYSLGGFNSSVRNRERARRSLPNCDLYEVLDPVPEYRIMGLLGAEPQSRPLYDENWEPYHLHKEEVHRYHLPPRPPPRALSQQDALPEHLWPGWALLARNLFNLSYACRQTMSESAKLASPYTANLFRFSCIRTLAQMENFGYVDHHSERDRGFHFFFFDD
ncbi:NAD(P)-binding protein [Lindgomyces ingoldianus]|uniref:NAD(P)-binding protein n=1 Tax=Lindgomyces ingoldianus TaxID=673940 RepID=A0ACB6Q6V1_9PLEO|nr:NAD(P)-binding protein [Lindgomyces ingoldianus]KAF2462558.1 NAD(P)-binding protein [Lindgomyces ingoldianus]